ncbi:MAG: response regulator [Cyclobacteriaceae bacterium]
MGDVRSKPSRRAKKEYSILYVDDEMPNLRGFKSTFRWYYNVFTALSGPEALEILAEKKIDIVVSDHRMPEMNGTDLLRQVYEMYPDAKRMILSGFIKRDELGEAVGSFGIHEFVSKPWDFDNLNGIFQTLLTTDAKVKSFEVSH